MAAVMSVAGIDVEPGQRVMREVTAHVAGRAVTVPIIAINGAADGPRVTITGGVHGAEYVGIEAARRLGVGIDPREVSGSIVVVPIANTSAFHARAIYTSGLDDRNLNRQFPGDAHGAPSEALAVTSGSTYAAATAAAIPSILAEIGGQGVWSEDEVAAHQEGALRVLRYLHVLPGDQQIDQDRPIHDTFAWMRAEVDGLFHPTVRVGETVAQGQSIGRITDYFGAERQRLAAVVGGEVGFLVTSLAINAGDPLLAIIA